MALPQQKFREIVFLLLYSYDTGKSSDDDMVKVIMAELAVTKKSVLTALERVHLIKAKLNEIDDLITSVSQTYSFDRIQSVERNVLRLGVYELLFDNEIPPKVAISEAIRLGKKFATPESSNFINALLDAIYKKNLGENIDLNNLAASVETLKESEKLSEEVAKTTLLTKEEDD